MDTTAKKIRVFSLLLALLALLPGASRSEVTGPAEEFSAVQILTGPQGEEKGRIFCSQDRWRVELNFQGKPMVQVFRLDKKVIWIMMPEDKVFLQMPLFPDQIPWAEKVPGEVERKLLGEESVRGHPALKYIVKVWNGEIASEIYLWISQQLKVPVKTSSLDGRSGSELQDIKVGPQPGELFEVPADFKLISPLPHP